MAARCTQGYYEVILLFPTLVLTRSGSEGKISACVLQTPLK